ncbi:MAG: hypothetical protein ACYC8T_05325 [Myxococcaceae bacterium]
MRAGLAIAIAGASALLSGCPSITTLGSARTMDEGRIQVLFAPEATTMGAYDPSGGQRGDVTSQAELGARYGVNDFVEVGAKAWLVGMAMDAKFALIRSPTPERGFNLALDPGVGYLTLSSSFMSGAVSANVVTLYFPVMLGYRFAFHEITVTPKFIDQISFGSGALNNVPWLGASAGVSFRLGAGLRLMPEVSVVYPFTAGNTSQWPMFQGGVGFLFGQETAPAGN